MNATPLHSALRELRDVYTDIRALAVMGVLGVVLGLAGPFDTFSQFGDGMRILYWTMMVFVTFGVGLFGGGLVTTWLIPSRRPLWRYIPIMALGAAIPVTLTVQLINRLFFAEPAFQGWDGLALFFYCFVISMAVGAVLDGLLAPMLAAARAGPARQDAPQSAPILQRLPHELRGPLTHMSMADHYVEVFTSKGSSLVLMRLADAIAETQGIEGMQIHRSHWVARDAVRGFKRENGRTMLELGDGTRLPVSRSFLAPVRASFSPERPPSG